MIKRKCNCCDGIYNSYDVHFTSLCDNKCAHCVDQCYEGLKIDKPDVDAIVNTIIKNQEGLEDVLFLGGEPCLFLEELIECVKKLKEKTSLKIYITTSVPNYFTKKSCENSIKDSFVECESKVFEKIVELMNENKIPNKFMAWGDIGR